MAKIWIDDRHYKIKHVGVDGEYWKTYKTNITKDALYITEEEAERLAAEYEGGKEMTSLRQWQNGVDEQGRKVYYETEKGKTIPICAYEVKYKKDRVVFVYTKVSGEKLENVFMIEK